jgi:hypothetical protein
MNLGDLADQLALDLNDAAPGYRNSTWSREQLVFYLGEGLVKAFSQRPDLFKEVLVLKLEAGSLQEICDCQKLEAGDVLGQSTAGGRVLYELKSRSADLKLAWLGRHCPDEGSFRLKEYAVSADGRTLKVFPPVPPRTDVWLAVRCALVPDGEAGTTVNGELQPAVMQWGLYRALMVEGENNPAVLQMAARHEVAFWRLLLSKPDLRNTGIEGSRRTASD